MHITIAALGTRGDVQPYLALALGLKQAGHTIRMIAGENFRDWICSYGFEFAGSGDMEALMHSPDALKWVDSGHNPIKQVVMMRRVFEQNFHLMIDPILDAVPQTDLFMAGFISEPLVQLVSEKFGTPYMAIPLQPYYATRSSAASLYTLTQRDSWLNRRAGVATERIMFTINGGTLNKARRAFDMPSHRFSALRRAVLNRPRIYGFSPLVVPRPSDWSEQSHIVGYWFLDQSDWTPPQDLLDFLDSGDPPVYIGFGSMSGSSPQATFDLSCEALKRVGRRGIISTGWSRAALDHGDDIYVLKGAPHSWLFPRMAAVVHHGGAGTTGASLASGKPTMVIPHFTDQPYWGRRVHELGVGAKPVPRHALTVEKLARGLLQMTRDTEMIERAAMLGESIRAENGVENAVRLIECYGKKGLQ